MKIAVLGGGHGCYAAAADLAEAGHEVRLWRRDAAALAPVVEAGTIGLIDANGRRDVGIAMATRRHRRGAGRGRADRRAEPGDRAGRHRAGDGAAPAERPGRVPAAGHLRQLRHGAHRPRRGLEGRGRVGRDRHPALPGAQARAARGAGDDPGGAPADRRLSGAAGRRGARRDRPRLPVGAWLRRRPVGRADERRAGDPSAADGDERGAAAALRALGHPCRGHAAGGARRHRPARPRADRGPRGARLRARRTTRSPTTTRTTAGCTATRTSSSSTRATGASTSTCITHRYVTEDTELGLAFLASVARWCGVDAPIAHGLLAVTGGFLGRDLRHGSAHPRGARPRRARPRRALQQRLHDRRRRRSGPTMRWHAMPPSAPAAWAAASRSPSPTPATPIALIDSRRRERGGRGAAARRGLRRDPQQPREPGPARRDGRRRDRGHRRAGAVGRRRRCARRARRRRHDLRGRARDARGQARGARRDRPPLPRRRGRDLDDEQHPRDPARAAVRPSRALPQPALAEPGLPDPGGRAERASRHRAPRRSSARARR